jgi:hypothetical protein
MSLDAATDGATDGARRAMENLTITIGIMSVVGSFSILLTLVLFNSMLFREARKEQTSTPHTNDTERATIATATTPATTATASSTTEAQPQKRGHNVYVHMIAMLSLSEMLGAAAFAFGFPSNDSMCTVQGVLVQFFQRAKWIWNALIGFQLYRFMVHDQSGLQLWQMHGLAWGLCLLLEVLPFTNNISYGSDDGEIGYEVCYFKGQGDEHTLTWVTLVYFVPLSICVIVMMYFAYKLWLRFRYIANLPEQTSTTHKITKLVRTLILYPLAMLFTTLPNMILFLAESVNPNYTSIKSRYLNGNVCFAWSFTYGLWLCAIFFMNSQEAKRRWRALLCGVEYTDVGNRLVRSDQTWKQNTEEVTNIDKAMDQALDAGLSRSLRHGSSNSQRMGSGSSHNHRPSFINRSESGSAVDVERGPSPQVQVKHGVSGSLVAQGVENSGAVYSSSSAVYGDDKSRAIVVEPISPNKNVDNPMHNR